MSYFLHQFAAVIEMCVFYFFNPFTVLHRFPFKASSWVKPSPKAKRLNPEQVTMRTGDICWSRVIWPCTKFLLQLVSSLRVIIIQWVFSAARYITYESLLRLVDFANKLPFLISQTSHGYYGRLLWGIVDHFWTLSNTSNAWLDVKS